MGTKDINLGLIIGFIMGTKDLGLIIGLLMGTKDLGLIIGP